jgi:hypothetical protein
MLRTTSRKRPINVTSENKNPLLYLCARMCIYGQTPRAISKDLSSSLRGQSCMQVEKRKTREQYDILYLHHFLA